MYVRLAFAVAAHLEPEILIIDEVLAVGDAEFQKKCLGKMKNVSVNEERTVLFVSHNMTAMNLLSNSILYLNHGKNLKFGDTKDVINTYLSSGSETTTRKTWNEAIRPGDDVAKIYQLRLVNGEGNEIDAIDFYKGGGIQYSYEVLKTGFIPIPNLYLFNQQGDHIFASADPVANGLSEIGMYRTTMWIPPQYNFTWLGRPIIHYPQDMVALQEIIW